MLTIFTTLKPFSNPHINIIQRNAIQSWVNIRPKCEIILLGNDKGVREVAREFSILHIPRVAVNHKGLPLIRSLFQQAQKVAKFPLLCYVNGDIILLDDLFSAVKMISREMNKFLVVGRRWDMEIKTPLTFSGKWQSNLKALVLREGILHGYSGIDFFVFPKSIFSRIPDLVVGRACWDNWMIFYARAHNIPVVDITKSAVIIHQDHDLPGSRLKASRFNDECAKKNAELAGGYKNLLTIRDASWVLEDSELHKRKLSYISLFYPWRLLLAYKRRLQH